VFKTKHISHSYRIECFLIDHLEIIRPEVVLVTMILPIHMFSQCSKISCLAWISCNWLKALILLILHIMQLF
jgi:hypothetical protein